jgi:hypothetical protein
MLAITTSAAGSSWSAERSHLVADALHNARSSGQDSCQTLHLRVFGESMLPTLWPGDLVEISPCSPHQVSPGEIVLALRDGRLFLHRLVAACEADGFLLCGDSVPRADLRFPVQALLGRLVDRVDSRPGSSPFRFALRPGLAAKLSRALGLLLCHFGPARRLALRLHSRRRASSPESYTFETRAESEAL